MAQFKITPDKESIKRINEIIKDFNRMKGSITGTVDEAKKFRAMHTALTGLVKVSKEATIEFDKQNRALKNMTKSQRNYKTQLENQKRKTKELQQANDKLNNSLKKTQTQTKKAGFGFKNILGFAKKLIGAFGLLAGFQIFKNIIKNAFELTKTFDSLSFALQRIHNEMALAVDSTNFLRDITTRFGAELVSTTNRWIKFLAAAKQSGLGLKETEDIFRSMTKAAGVLGLRTDELQGIYLALEQMLSKGKVTTEELRRQLGERLPGAMGIMAAALGKTIPELDKMLKLGQVLSADALPKFARAVEIAYGIENVKNVDTLVAAQNRLTTSWQIFIQSITQGDTEFKKFFKYFVDSVTYGINLMRILWQGPDADSADRVNKYTREFTKNIEDAFTKQIELENKHGVTLEGLREKKRLAAIELERSQGTDLKKIKEEEYSKAVIAETNFLNERDARIKLYAKENIKTARDAYLKDLEEKEKLEKQFADATRKIKKGRRGETEKTDFSLVGDKSLSNIQDYQSQLKKLQINLDKTSAVWIKLRKLQEDGTPAPVKIDGPALRALENERDLSLEIQKEITESHVKRQEDILKSDESTIKEREQALDNWIFHQEEVALKEKEIAIRNLEEKNKVELEKNIKLNGEGKLLAGEFDRWLLEKENNTKQELELIDLKYKETSLNNENKFRDKKIQLIDDGIKEEIEIFTTSQKAKIGALKEEYLNSETTAKRRKEISIEVAELESESANLIIKKTIEIMEAKYALMEATDSQAISLKKIIEDLRASLNIKPKDNDDVAAWQEKFDAILGYAKEFASALGDLSDNLFASNIEDINAEIEASSNKYDKLIELNENDENQQKVLRRNKELHIQELEKERLKQEQKQAKAKKAFAVADIAISTAQGIAASIKTGPLGLWAIPIIIALGAVQTAAVLATPIPKYKDGGFIKDDHVGMINDGGRTEFIERGGELYATGEKNALVNLEKGDVIHKNFESLKSNTNFIKGYDDVAERDIMMFTAYNKSKELQNLNLDRMLLGIEKSINKGFKGVKINNNVNTKVVNDYGESLSRWN